MCGDAAEHVKAGAGQKYVFFDADFYKETFQRAVLSEPGAPGACSLYDGDASEHSEFAIQACNEKLVYVKHMPDGRNRYEWKSAEPHDFLDCMSMCYAVAASKGITGASAVRRLAGPVRGFRRRPRVRVV